jgi:hypothetical protein
VRSFHSDHFFFPLPLKAQTDALPCEGALNRPSTPSLNLTAVTFLRRSRLHRLRIRR